MLYTNLGLIAKIMTNPKKRAKTSLFLNISYINIKIFLYSKKLISV